MPGASPQSGTTEMPAASAASDISFCRSTSSVLPPRSQKWAPDSIAIRVMSTLK